MPTTSAANLVGFHHLPPLPGGGMKSLKSTMTCVQTDVVTTVEALPRNFNLVDVVHVDLKKMLVIK